MRRLLILSKSVSLPVAVGAAAVVSSGTVVGVACLVSSDNRSKGLPFILGGRLFAHCDNSRNKMSEEENNIPGLYSQDKLRSMSINISGMRIPYHGKDEAFTEDQLVAKEPFAQFNHWFERAAVTEGIQEPNAMCLSTSTKDGKPSSRMVLLKGYGIDGFKFFTNYCSRKGRELEENPYVALNFYWEPMKRCIRIEGRVEKLSMEEATEYFHERPMSSQIGAAISPQSQPVPGREYLIQKEKELSAKVANKEATVQKPDSWGGFVVVPETVEFWQGQTTRIHDRIRFRKRKAGEVPDNVLVHEGVNGWVYERLGP